MPTKSDRILGYLPGTFRRAPDLSALFAIVDAFGSELQLGENSLAAVMAAHWVDHADRGAETITDLALIASLYGLAPRRHVPVEGDILCALPPLGGETVEEFREHLKRYIRTYLEGTVTVQGILRVTAEALGLHIADAYKDIDAWWERKNDGLITILPRREYAAQLLLGRPNAAASGQPAQPARIKGKVDLSQGVDLRPAAILRLQVEQDEAVEIDLVDGAPDPRAVPLAWLTVAINVAMKATVANQDGPYLTLASPNPGPGSRLEVLPGPNDASQRLLGLAPRAYFGTEAQPASVTGEEDLSQGADLRQEHFLRLVIDESQVFEIELPQASQVRLDQLTAAINRVLGGASATHDDRYLTVTTDSVGIKSSIRFERPASQDARARLFGDVSLLHLGQDERSALMRSSRDLGPGADLREGGNLFVSLDGGEFKVIDCTGADPANTRPGEIVAAINSAFEETIARQDGRFITLASQTVGAGSSIRFEAAPSGDATEAIFGIRPYGFVGSAATRARIEGTVDLGEKVNVIGQHLLRLEVDSQSHEIDLRNGIKELTPTELTDVINSKSGGSVATLDGQRLVLRSINSGHEGTLRVETPDEWLERRFLSRAKITDEAAQAVLGFVERQAQGTPAAAAQLVGERDLSRGIDLRQKRYLRLIVDDRPAMEIDCAGPRPRATLLGEVVQNINQHFETAIASDNGQNLILTSPTAGANSRIAFEPPHSTDARAKLLGIEPVTVRGQNGTTVRLVGTADLSEGVALEADAAIQLAVDGAPPVKVVLVEESTSLELGQLVDRINDVMGRNVAESEGPFLVLTSDESGENSRIDLDPAGQIDATRALFGFPSPRSYQGAPDVKAQIVGQTDLGGTVDLSVARFLMLSVDFGPVVLVDCAANSGNPAAATLDEIVEAINETVKSEPASKDGPRLVLTSPSKGSAGQLKLEAYAEGTVDAREQLFGPAAGETTGIAPTPAVITGEVNLSAPADLSRRSKLRLAVDGGPDIDIDVAGAVPETTTLEDVVTAINATVPGLAAGTEDDRLQLTSPTSGEDSYLAVRPLRYLEVIEYPPEPEAEELEVVVGHGDHWAVANRSTAEEFATISLHCKKGAAGPVLVNRTMGWLVRLTTPLSAGETIELWRDLKHGLKACIRKPSGETQGIRGDQIMVGPLGSQAIVPYTGGWLLVGGSDDPATLQLNNPVAPGLDILRARQPGLAGQIVRVFVTPHLTDQRLFDVRLLWEPSGGEAVEELYSGVAIGQDPEAPEALVRQINAGPDRSRLVTAEPLKKEAILRLSPGKTDWTYLECRIDRYDMCDFDEARFAGDWCEERGIFDISRYANKPPEQVQAVYAPDEPLDDSMAKITFRWPIHLAGAFLVNLPADLPIRYGGFYGQARFGQAPDEPERYAGVVVEPPDDPDHLVTKIGDREKSLVTAQIVPLVELGWEAVEMPFRQPHYLSLGNEEQAARTYLSEEGLDGFIRIDANSPGSWGNEIALSARLTGPASYDVCIVYQGGRFENARLAAEGEPPPALTQEMLAASSIGVLQAKAAGVRADVTRDRARDRQWIEPGW